MRGGGGAGVGALWSSPMPGLFRLLTVGEFAKYCCISLFKVYVGGVTGYNSALML
jgi:hypothetical protein